MLQISCGKKKVAPHWLFSVLKKRLNFSWRVICYLLFNAFTPRFHTPYVWFATHKQLYSLLAAILFWIGFGMNKYANQHNLLKVTVETSVMWKKKNNKNQGIAFKAYNTTQNFEIRTELLASVYLLQSGPLGRPTTAFWRSAILKLSLGLEHSAWPWILVYQEPWIKKVWKTWKVFCLQVWLRQKTAKKKGGGLICSRKACGIIRLIPILLYVILSRSCLPNVCGLTQPAAKDHTAICWPSPLTLWNGGENQEKMKACGLR